RRGLLDTTLRHEIAHAVSAEALAGRPRWVQEGVARHLSGDEAPDAVADPRCPADEEFAAADSAAALRRLYDRSLACARRSLAEVGGHWRAVR
nr:hypothetical protein [Vicinamibacterales bacterium]